MGRGRRDQSFAYPVDEHDRRYQHFADGPVQRQTATHPAFVEPRGTVTALQRQPQPWSRRQRCHGRPLVNRIPYPRLAGSGRRRVRLPQVRSADGARSEVHVRVGCRGVAQHDIVSRQLLRDAHVCGSRVFRQKVSNN